MYIGQLYYTSTKLVNLTYLKQYKLYCYVRGKDRKPSRISYQGRPSCMGILSRRQNGGSAFVSAPASSCPPRFKFQWVSHGVHAANEPSLIALQSFTWPHQQRPHAAPKNYGRRKCHTCWGGRLNYVPGLRPPPESASFSPQQP